MRREIVVCILLGLLIVSCARGPPSREQVQDAEQPLQEEQDDAENQIIESLTLYPIVDVHTHPVGSGGEGVPSFCTNEDGCIDAAVAEFEDYNIVFTLMMPPPFQGAPSEQRLVELEGSAQASAEINSEAFGYVAGGYLLNSMIQNADDAGSVDADTEEAFEAYARDLAESGAIGFGELAILHMTPEAEQLQSIASAGDNKLYQILADIAAEYDMPIDVHMEAVEVEQETPERFKEFDSEYPDTIDANVAGFEDLLEHNTDTKIVWAHGGWDNTGQKTIALTERLLADHPNLYIHLQLEPSLYPENSVLDTDGNVYDEWMELFQNYPDRFMLGTDRFFVAPGFEKASVTTSYADAQDFLNQLPDDVALKVGCQNAVEVYNLDISCE